MIDHECHCRTISLHNEGSGVGRTGEELMVGDPQRVAFLFVCFFPQFHNDLIAFVLILLRSDGVSTC